MSKKYRREYISELCQRLIPNLEDEQKQDDIKPLHEAIKDLIIRLRNASDFFKQHNKEDK